MLELPEVLTLAGQLKQEAAGKSVAYVLPPAKPHKFCWFSGDPSLPYFFCYMNIMESSE